MCYTEFLVQLFSLLLHDTAVQQSRAFIYKKIIIIIHFLTLFSGHKICKEALICYQVNYLCSESVRRFSLYGFSTHFQQLMNYDSYLPWLVIPQLLELRTSAMVPLGLGSKSNRMWYGRNKTQTVNSLALKITFIFPMCSSSTALIHL